MKSDCLHKALSHDYLSSITAAMASKEAFLSCSLHLHVVIFACIVLDRILKVCHCTRKQEVSWSSSWLKRVRILEAAKNLMSN